MALSDTLLTRLIEATREHDLGGRFVMLGRQRWVGTRKGIAATLFAETLARYLPDYPEEALKNPDDAFCENFFRILGFDQVDSMDFSDYEGASVIQDLSAELDPGLIGAFDVVYDGGTCEHIFNLPKAFENIDKMLAPGGSLIGHSPCNNWINHAFYQFTPELVYGYWEKAMGYEVLHLSLQPLLPNFAHRVATTTNPNETGKRPRIKGNLPKNSPIILNYVVRKPTGDAARTKGVYQTDYLKKWEDGG